MTGELRRLLHEDLEVALAHLGGGAADIRHDQRFFLELDFATILVRDWSRAREDERYAVEVLGIPAWCFDFPALDVENHLFRVIAQRPFHRAHSAIRGGSSATLDALGVSDATVVRRIAWIFLALIRRHYAGDGAVPRELPPNAGRAFRRFANGSLRRAPTAAEKAGARGAFNCEPNGYLNFLFAEFAAEAVRAFAAAPAAAGREPLEPFGDGRAQRWWAGLWRTMVGALEIYAETYWDRALARVGSAYGPAAWSARKTWSEEEMQALWKRYEGLDDDALTRTWSRTLASAFRDDGLLDSPTGR